MKMMKVLVQLFPDDQDQAWTFLFIPDDMELLVISSDSVGTVMVKTQLCIGFFFFNKDNLNPDSFICIWFRKEIFILKTKSISTILRLRGDTDIFLPRHASGDIRFLVSENDMDWSVCSVNQIKPGIKAEKKPA